MPFSAPLLTLYTNKEARKGSCVPCPPHSRCGGGEFFEIEEIGRRETAMYSMYCMYQRGYVLYVLYDNFRPEIMVKYHAVK